MWHRHPERSVVARAGRRLSSGRARGFAHRPACRDREPATVRAFRRRPAEIAAAAVLALAVGAAEVSACPAGLPPSGAAGGDLGPAPAGSYAELFCIEVANDRPRERSEVVASAVALPRSPALLTTDGLALVAPGGRRLAAQFEVLGRWGGPLAEGTLPIRWLEVAFPARVAPGGMSSYSLRLDAAPPPADPLALSVVVEGGLYRIDTGAAEFVLDPQSPALLAEIRIDPSGEGAGFSTVYQHVPGAGPRLVVPGASGLHDLGTDSPSEAVVDPAGFQLERTGPVRAVARLDGHLVAPGGETRCGAGPLDYERFGYTVVATFERGRRDVLLELHLRNECSDGWSGPWTDQAVTVERFSWELPFAFGAGAEAYFGGDAPLGTVALPAAVTVEQRDGGGSPWRRRARARAAGALVESAESFARPLVAVADGATLAAVQMPWMRFREPQALESATGGLALVPISRRLVVGEGKGLWSWGLLAVEPLAAGQSAAARLEALRVVGIDRLERALLGRAAAPAIDRAGVLPALGARAATPLAAEYERRMDELHRQTVDPGGQWDRARTFGSQLWPDVQADPWAIDYVVDPTGNNGAMNYWNPSGAELLEFLRTGDPRWAWEFALPQSWLQAHTAYLNLGERTHGNRAGFAVTSGGEGEGQWHRSAYGSDDYSYDMGIGLAYLVRPSPALRARLRQAGRTVVDRYSVPEGGGRERWVSEVDLTRQVVQHLWLLADCAEFVPGAAGQACQDRLAAIVAELAEDNLAAGVLCQGDDPGDPCWTPQQFMQNALVYPFLDRLYRNYGDALGVLSKAVVEAPWNLYRFGLPRTAGGVDLDPAGDWAAGLVCDLAPGGGAVASCQAAADSDGNLGMYAPTKPHTAALLLMSDAHDPSHGLCAIARRALDDPSLTGGWVDFLSNDSGWWKGAAQMLQSMAFAVGLAERCGGPPLCHGWSRVELLGERISGRKAHFACDRVAAVSGVVVEAGGELVLESPGTVVLGDGLVVASGAQLSAGN